MLVGASRPGHLATHITPLASGDDADRSTAYVAVWARAPGGDGFTNTRKLTRPTLVGAAVTLNPFSATTNGRRSRTRVMCGVSLGSGRNHLWGAPRPSQTVAAIARRSSKISCQRVIRATRMLDTTQKDTSFSTPLYRARPTPNGGYDCGWSWSWSWSSLGAGSWICRKPERVSRSVSE